MLTEQLPGVCGTGGMLFVDQAATGANTGLTWSNAFTDLQTALASARNCQVWVAKGVYFPTDTTDRTQAFLLRSGVQVYGGFAGTETLLSQRDWFANPTVLSGDIDHNDTNKDPNGIVPNVSDIVGANAYHVLVGSGADQTAVFDGFIINAGQATLDPYTTTRVAGSISPWATPPSTTWSSLPILPMLWEAVFSTTAALLRSRISLSVVTR